MDDYSLKILETIETHSGFTLIQLSTLLNADWMVFAEPINYLRKLNYLNFEPNYATLNDLTQESPLSPNTPLVISYEGRAALEVERRQRRHIHFDQIRAWATLAIAFAALIVSVIALQR